MAGRGGKSPARGRPGCRRLPPAAAGLTAPSTAALALVMTVNEREGPVAFPSRRALAGAPDEVRPLAVRDGQKSLRFVGLMEHLTGIRCRDQQVSLHRPGVIANPPGSGVFRASPGVAAGGGVCPWGEGRGVVAHISPR